MTSADMGDGVSSTLLGEAGCQKGQFRASQERSAESSQVLSSPAPGGGFSGPSIGNLCEHIQKGSEARFLCQLMRKAGGLLDVGGWQEGQRQTRHVSHTEVVSESQWRPLDE